MSERTTKYTISYTTRDSKLMTEIPLPQDNGLSQNRIKGRNLGKIGGRESKLFTTRQETLAVHMLPKNKANISDTCGSDDDEFLYEPSQQLYVLQRTLQCGSDYLEVFSAKRNSI